MSIATYDVAPLASAAAPSRQQNGFFARILAHMIAARQRQAESELRRHSILLPSELEAAGWKIDERSEDSLPFRR